MHKGLQVPFPKNMQAKSCWDFWKHLAFVPNSWGFQFVQLDSWLHQVHVGIPRNFSTPVSLTP